MAFVMLDVELLNSTLWLDREAREVFITALLMARPVELQDSIPVIEVRTLDLSGWEVPTGPYGIVEAAGVGIVKRAGLEREEGLAALERLASPEPDSRSQDFDGRRMVRVDGGYIILNFDKYRKKDHTSAARSKRYREKKRHAVTPRSVTQEKENANPKEENYSDEFELLWKTRPRRAGQDPKAKARKAYLAALKKNGTTPDAIQDGAQRWATYMEATGKVGTEYIARLVTWLHEEGWTETWDLPTDDAVEADLKDVMG